MKYRWKGRKAPYTTQSDTFSFFHSPRIPSNVPSSYHIMDCNRLQDVRKLEIVPSRDGVLETRPGGRIDKADVRGDVI